MQTLFDSLKFEQNLHKDEVTRLEVYANGHLFKLFDSPVDKTLLKRIAIGTGVGVSEADLEVCDTFKDRLVRMTTLANERNCLLYVDAEQSYIQDAIASWGQQLTHQFNRGEKHIILNGYQCYLKRTTEAIKMEVAASKVLGYNIGIKLIRGAYMNEERKLAQEHGYESPIWDTLEHTHRCYNDSMLHILDNLTEDSMLLIASHNMDSVQLAKNKMLEVGIADSRVRFAQLKAFSDHITSQLALENFQVYKYLPYGPMEEVMPYLIRRGQESKQVVREQTFQNVFLKNEIKRRMNLFSKA